MADHGTAIEWTQAPGFKGETWNPVTGCDRVSPGCAHCYALDVAAANQRKERGRIAKAKREGKPAPKVRYQRDGDPKTSGPGFGLTLHPDKLEEPLHWKKPRMVFVNSMSDLFHEEIPDGFIARVFGVMASAPDHIFQVLTKRPDRMQALLSSYRFHCEVAAEIGKAKRPANGWATIAWHDDNFLDNVWLGVTIENRRFVHRADLLRQTPAAVRFISAEPLLGPLVAQARHNRNGVYIRWRWEDGYTGPDLDLRGIDWLIVGGESGPNHRPIDPNWVRHLRMRCTVGRRGPAFFFKQWGGSTAKAGGRELDGRTWSEFPAVLSTSQRAA